MPYSASGFVLFAGDIISRTDQINGNLRRGAEVGEGQTIVADPDDANGPSMMQCLTKGSPDATPAYYRAKCQHSESGNPIASPTTVWDTARVLARVKANLQSTNGVNVYTLRIGNGSTNGVVILSLLYNSGTSKLKVRTICDGTTTTTTNGILNENTLYDIFVYYKKSSGANDGVLQVSYAVAGGSPSLIAELDLTHNETAQVGQFDCMGGVINSGAAFYATYFVGVGWCFGDTIWNRRFGNPEDLWYSVDRGLGVLREPRTDKMVIKSTWMPGQYRHSWAALTDMKADVYYIEGTTWPGDGHASLTNGATMDLDENNDWIGFATLSGLSAGTTYTAKVVPYSNATPGTLYWPTRTLQFTTLTDDNSDIKFAFGSCNDPSSGSPFEWAEYIRQSGAQIFFHLGDQQYEESGLSDTIPWERKKDFLIDRLDFEWERWLDNMQRFVPMMLLPDDHEVANNWNAAWRQGYVDASGNPTGANGSEYSDLIGGDYGVTVTKGDVYDACREGFYIAEAQGFLDCGHAGSAGYVDREYYRSFTVGPALFIVCDMRGFEDQAGTEPTSGGAATQFGAAQLAWIQNLIDTTAANLIVFVHQSPWSDTNAATHGDDHYDEIAQAERNAIWSRIEDRDSIWWLHIAGDMHLNMVTRRAIAGIAGLEHTMRGMICELTVGALCKHAASLDGDVAVGGTNDKSKGVFHFSIHGQSQGDIIRSFGVATISPASKAVSISVHDGDNNSALYTNTWHRGGAPTGYRSRPSMTSRRETWLGGRP